VATESNLRPRLSAPLGACDTHMHIYDHRFPLAATATFDPPDALVPQYLAMRKRLGVERNVVVQPTAYGKDNRCTLEAIAAIGPSARGVAVVDDTVADAELERLTTAGIRGARFHMLAGAAVPWEILERVAARTREFGWHIQLQLDGRELPEHEPLIRKVTGTLVIDHVGKFLEPVPINHPGFHLLLKLVENGRTYVKLSAPYEVSKLGPPNYDDVGVLAKVLVHTAPERMLWATNWPHPTPVTASPKPDDAHLLDMLLDWVPDETTRRKVLTDNPATLYGFS
jgi:D-galactarolactone isomerase